MLMLYAPCAGFLITHPTAPGVGELRFNRPSGDKINKKNAADICSHEKILCLPPVTIQNIRVRFASCKVDPEIEFPASLSPRASVLPFDPPFVHLHPLQRQPCTWLRPLNTAHEQNN
jgi:hypothetical protein